MEALSWKLFKENGDTKDLFFVYERHIQIQFPQLYSTTGKTVGKIGFVKENDSNNK